MSNIPTALEIVQKHLHDPNGKPTAITDAMVEFAKLHVEAALRTVVKEIHPEIGTYYLKDDNTILNAYPPSNIK